MPPVFLARVLEFPTFQPPAVGSPAWQLGRCHAQVLGSSVQLLVEGIQPHWC